MQILEILGNWEEEFKSSKIIRMMIIMEVFRAKMKCLHPNRREVECTEGSFNI